MLVKFSTYRSRQRVYAARSMLSKDKRPPNNPWKVAAPQPPDDVATDSSGPPSPQSGPPSPDEASESKEDENELKIWINEDLTKARATLLWEARKMKKAGRDITDCWSFDGAILVKNKHGKVKQIKTLKCLQDVNKD